MISLGRWVDVSLEAARERAADARDLLSQGIDPSAHRKAEKAARKLTFTFVAREWLSARESILRKGKLTPLTFKKQRQILERYVLPSVGSRPLKLIATQELSALLIGIESKGLADTAHRARRACSRIFNFAQVRGLVDHNPVDALPFSTILLRPILSALGTLPSNPVTYARVSRPSP